MTSNIRNVIDEINTRLRTIGELKNVPDNPPESNDQFPFAYAYPTSGRYEQISDGFRLAFYDVSIDLHISLGEQTLPLAFDEVLSIMDDIPAAIQDNLGSYTTILTWNSDDGGGITFVFGELSFGNVPTLGVTYTLPQVKVDA